MSPMRPEEMEWIVKEIHELKERVESLEEDREEIKQIPLAISELKGQVNTLHSLLVVKLEGVQSGVEKATSVRTAIQFASVVLVPILVAILGGYFALRAGVTK